ncbi:deoxyribodipyrimidine photo-lyase [Flocculibacter collagenilyticus]|uniref:deoxyribodipyrimidine photo-lyase n=1 Tax=Flocculibacter collagenilyticus TaxID=2744479 RepID=UPI0018F58D86|nr:deoxyribodipyrimidine photo-lyase [Flocculibacter collagenilyticus]
MSTALHWFRNDLRIADNPGLTKACDTSSHVIGVYCICEKQMQQHGEGSRRFKFILDNLTVLKAQLADLNIPLIILDSKTFEGAVEDIVQMVDELSIESLCFNVEYPINERLRDKLLCEQLEKSASVSVHRLVDQSLIHPAKVLNGSGQPYKVFTPFKKACISMLAEYDLMLDPTPKQQSEINDNKLNKLLTQSDELIKHYQNQLAANSQSDCKIAAGEVAAEQALNKFIGGALQYYPQQRDIPSDAGTSQLSPYLAVGVLSVKQCWLKARQIRNESTSEKAINTWCDELIWRDFYRYVMWHQPTVCKHNPFQAWTDKVQWTDNNTHFQRWCEGKTGIPIVDAGMRQMNETGWMHNRVRMIVASFLCKNLLADWRKGEAYFMQQLVDADFPSNNGGWQWSASVGTDAAPYFRVFNPMLQAERFDPEGEYIKRWVPELAKVDKRILHKENLKKRHSHSLDYPEPIVDLKATRQAAIDAFKEAK